jgi:hypothetical protein
MAELINQIRFYHFISGVLHNQQSDPLCSNCKAFANTAKRMKENIAELESVNIEKMHTLPAEMLHILEEAQERIGRIKIFEDAVGQKKAGNCRLPEGLCFIKLSKAIADKVNSAP